jgi:hypothetical protein
MDAQKGGLNWYEIDTLSEKNALLNELMKTEDFVADVSKVWIPECSSFVVYVNFFVSHNCLSLSSLHMQK